MRVMRFVLAIVIFCAAYRAAVHKRGTPQPDSTPARQTPTSTAAPDPVAKMNAYIEFNNRIVEWQHFDKEIEALKDKNRALQSGKAQLANIYSTSPSIGADDVGSLKKAVGMQPAIPDVDPQATAMLTAVSAQQPTEQALVSYEISKEYLSDHGAKARKLLPVLIQQMAATAKAEVVFGQGITHWKFQQDEALLRTLDKNSLQYLTLNESMAARHVLEAVNQYHGKAEAKHLDEALPQLVAANNALSDYKTAGDTKGVALLGDMNLKDYRKEMQKVIGTARLLSADLQKDPKSFISPQDMMYESRMTSAQMDGDIEDDDPPAIVETALLTSYNQSVNKLNELNSMSRLNR